MSKCDVIEPIANLAMRDVRKSVANEMGDGSLRAVNRKPRSIGDLIKYAEHAAAEVMGGGGAASGISFNL